jgi:peroxiredoxin
MKPSSSAFLAILILIGSCTYLSEKDSKKFTLQGEIIGQDTGIIVLAYWLNETLIYDTAKIKNTKFIFNGNIFGPTVATLNGRNGSNMIRLYLESQKMKISLSKDKFSEFKMTGSKTQNDFNLIQKNEKPFYEKISQLRKQQVNINDSIKNSKSASKKLLLENKSEEIDNLRSQILEKIDSVQIKFASENPKSFYAIVQLSILEANEVISLDATKSIFNRMDKLLKESRYGKEIIDDIRKKENIRIGNQAPDFKATDLNKQSVTLSQFKGKAVILMDFWASWCGPCRESIPHLKILSKKYHSKGFEVIAISEDENRKAWTEAVSQDSTSMWYHIPFAEKWPCKQSLLTNDDVYQNYFVVAIPQQILIDKNGKILYRNVGYSEESEKSLDKQLSQIFDN